MELVEQDALNREEDVREEFLCSCCYNLMIKPTSLMCGHNFCRGCLAQWYFSSNKKECPTCRQTWYGHPKVNITLRNMMLKMFKSEVESSEKALESNEELIRKLQEFDKQLGSKQSQPEQTDPKAFFTGILLTLTAILVIYLAWYWRNSDKDLLIKKPLWSWKPVDVNQWLKELTWAEDYSEFALQENIDGTMLMALDEKALQKNFHIENPLHAKALHLAIQGMTETGVKYPTNLWEYKSIYPGKSLFLLYGLKDFPRTTLLYLYLFKYEDVFLPFLHYTTGTDDNSYVITELPEPANWQLVTFVMYGLVLPYWLVGKCSWLFSDTHRWTTLSVMFSCILLSYLELYEIKKVLSEEHRQRSFVALVKKHFKTLISMSIFVIIWPVVPRLVCDFFFYAALYFAPIQFAYQLKNNIQNM